MEAQLMIMAHNYYPDTNAPSSMSVLGHEANFEFSDFLEANDWIVDDAPAFSAFPWVNYNPQQPNYTFSEVVHDNSSSISSSNGSLNEETVNSGTSGVAKKDYRDRVAFRTKSEVEILDDGFKWRKYGKKMVKNSPNPRNYYKCSAEGCSVKKRVERDTEDPRFVVTTYEGVHNHQRPML